jgi:hypothetical protein
MKKTITAFVMMIYLISSAESLFAENKAPALDARLSTEEQLLGSSTPITTTDVARLQALVRTIRTTKNPGLLSHAELILLLFREREHTKALAADHDRTIVDEARLIRGYRWRRTKDALVRVGFWVGLSSLGLIGVAGAVDGWATEQYVRQSTAAAATPYLITGEVSQLASTVGTIGALGGLGMAWLLSINPFDMPAPLADAAAEFPRSGMTSAEKINYLEKTKVKYQKRETRARAGRSISFAFLAAGLAGVLATAAAGYLGSLEYQKYAASTTVADTTAYRNALTIYGYITIGTASLAVLGLSSAAIGYLSGPDPAQLASSIDALDSRLDFLRKER